MSKIKLTDPPLKQRISHKQVHHAMIHILWLMFEPLNSLVESSNEFGDITPYISRICTPFGPKPMKFEGFNPSRYGLKPLKMKVVGSHGIHICYYITPSHVV